MARVTRAAAHLTLEEVKIRMRTDPRALYRQRWLIIYNALAQPRKAEEIARHCGVSKATVHQVISTYNRFGVVAVETPGKGGRRHQYPRRERSPPCGRSGRPLKPESDTRWMTARSIACSTVMAGASSCRVPGIRKPTRKSKSSLKKLCSAGSSGSRNAATGR